MSYQVLARKYRPQKFSEVIGQDHVTRTLKNAIEQGRTAHGYIFSGHRGIGKTTIARILAMALNCRSTDHPVPEPCGVCDSCVEIRAGNAVDVIEIDAATNRGIDEIRELRDAARYRPARDRYKIYILDEAHQITDAAFNALLKTLEEPPDHVIFMMATTQPEDIPQTIRSRCQHFSFHAVRFDDILTQLRTIAAAEEITTEDAALALLAEAGDGSMRDALSIMDQAIASAPVEDGRPRLDADQIRELMGSVPNTVFERLMEAINANHSAGVIEEINRLLNAGHSASQLARQYVRYLRNCLMARLGGDATELIQLSPDERARAARSASLFSEEDLARFLQMMLKTFDELNYRQEQRFYLELGLLKLVHLQRLLPIEEFLSQLPSAGGQRLGATKAPAALPATVRNASAAVAPREQALAPAARPQPQTPPPATKAPSFSPFEADRNRKSGDESMSAPPVVEAAQTVPVLPVAPPPRPPSPIEAVSQARPSVSPVAPESARQPAMPVGLSESITAGALALLVEPETGGLQSDVDLAAVCEAVASALENEGHHTAAALLSSASWTIAENTIQAAIAVKKTMLSLTMNSEAEKIAKAALRAAGWSQRLSVVSADGESPEKAAAPPRKTPAGSAHGRALKHPLIQQAQELFKSEVRSVIDLSEKP